MIFCALVFSVVFGVYEIYSLVGWVFNIEEQLPILRECDRPWAHTAILILMIVKFVLYLGLLATERDEFEEREDLKKEEFICRVDP